MIWEDKSELLVEGKLVGIPENVYYQAYNGFNLSRFANHANDAAALFGAFLDASPHLLFGHGEETVFTVEQLADRKDLILVLRLGQTDAGDVFDDGHFSL